MICKFALIGIPSVFFGALPALSPGAVFSSFSLFQNLTYATPGNPGATGRTEVTDQNIPFQQTDSISSGTGGLLTSTYTVSDTGAVAALSIGTSAVITGAYNSLEEDSSYYPNTYFSFAVPVSFSFLLSTTGGGSGGFELLNGPATLQLDNLEAGNTISSSGVLLPDIIYRLEENYGLSNGTNPQRTCLACLQTRRFRPDDAVELAASWAT
jgi:hypothetical protein